MPSSTGTETAAARTHSPAVASQATSKASPQTRQGVGAASSGTTTRAHPSSASSGARASVPSAASGARASSGAAAASAVPSASQAARAGFQGRLVAPRALGARLVPREDDVQPGVARRGVHEAPRVGGALFGPCRVERVDGAGVRRRRERLRRELVDPRHRRRRPRDVPRLRGGDGGDAHHIAAVDRGARLRGVGGRRRSACAGPGPGGSGVVVRRAAFFELVAELLGDAAGAGRQLRRRRRRRLAAAVRGAARREAADQIVAVAPDGLERGDDVGPEADRRAVGRRRGRGRRGRGDRAASRRARARGRADLGLRAETSGA